MAFCLPFSTALTLIFSIFGLLFGLLGFDWSAFKRVMRSPISILCVVLFAWLALSMFWSVAPRDELIEGISKYRKLLYVPLVAMLLVSTRVKPWFLMNFFVVGCLVVCLGSLSSSSGLLEHLIGPQSPGGGWALGGTSGKHWFYIGPPEAPTFGRAWIAQGAFLVFSVIYLIGLLLQTCSNQRNNILSVRAVSITLVTLTMVLVVLNLGGRTGYILLFFGLLLWVLKLSHWGQWKRSIALFLASIAIVSGFVGLNQRVVERTQAAITDVTQYRESGALTSQGLRLRFWEAGIRAGAERLLPGWGVGSYAEVFSRDSRQPQQLRSTRPHPHSEFVLLFVQGGLPALTSLLIILFTLCQWTLRVIPLGSSSLGVRSTGVLLACVLIMVDGLFNSTIWDAGEGHAFALFMGSAVVLAHVPSRDSPVG